MWLRGSPRTTFWKDHAPIELSWHPCQKLTDLKCMGVVQDSQSYSIDLYFYSYASPTGS